MTGGKHRPSIFACRRALRSCGVCSVSLRVSVCPLCPACPLCPLCLPCPPYPLSSLSGVSVRRQPGCRRGLAASLSSQVCRTEPLPGPRVTVTVTVIRSAGQGGRAPSPQNGTFPPGKTPSLAQLQTSPLTRGNDKSHRHNGAWPGRDSVSVLRLKGDTQAGFLLPRTQVCGHQRSGLPPGAAR